MKKEFLKVIALDFDGTLVESNLIMDQTFETIVSEWPEHKDAMMECTLPETPQFGGENSDTLSKRS